MLISVLTANRLDPSQYRSLQLLYSSTAGDRWLWTASGKVWNFTDESDPCESQWQGLACSLGSHVSSLKNNTVASIMLSGYGLNGTLAENIFPSLSSLMLLNLSRNSLRGTLPLSMSELIHLQILDLGWQKEISSLPVVVRQTQIRIIISHMCIFYGDIFCQDFFSIQGIETIYDRLFNGSSGNVFFSVPNEGMSGPLSNEIFAKMAQLRALILHVNKFTGQLPLSLCSCCQHLRVLSLGSNELSGAIPQCYGNISKMELFEISANNLTSTIPATLSRLSSLKYLVLASNKLNGTIPTSFGSSLLNLSYIVLRYNNFHGDISVFENLFNTSILDISYNYFSGALPANLTKLIHLKHFWASTNIFTGVIPTILGRLTSVNSLALSMNGFTGMIPMEIGNMISLNYLGDMKPNFVMFMIYYSPL